MASFFHILAGLALLAALAAWGWAVRGGLQSIADDRAAGLPAGFGRHLLLVLWPFAVKRRGPEADADAVRAGRAAFRSGAMQQQDSAQPSTPVLGTPFWHHP